MNVKDELEPNPILKPDQSYHPMLGRRCIVRTYSAGVHIGDEEKVSIKMS